MRARRAFTLVELMVVVSISTTVAGMGVWTISNRRRVEETRILARNIQFAIMRNRASAIGDGFQRQLSCTLSTCNLLKASTSGMAAPASWINEGQNVQSGSEARVWAIDATTDVGATNPGAGPLAGTKTINFYPDGTANAATVFITDLSAVQKYKIYIYAATGMPRLVDQW